MFLQKIATRVSPEGHAFVLEFLMMPLSVDCEDWILEVAARIIGDLVAFNARDLFPMCVHLGILDRAMELIQGSHGFLVHRELFRTLCLLFVGSSAEGALRMVEVGFLSLFVSTIETYVVDLPDEAMEVLKRIGSQGNEEWIRLVRECEGAVRAANALAEQDEDFAGTLDAYRM
jgi:hypothetical protein